jgi:hypothetical protein
MAFRPNRQSPILNVMNTIQPKILAIGGKWTRFVIVRESPEPDNQREYWAGEKWVREPRAALLYAHQKLVKKDLKKIRGED